MSKTDKIRGLPHDLLMSYLGTVNYFHCGYMIDWLLSVSYYSHCSEIEIDIINESVTPEHARIKPLIVYLPYLKSTISKFLLSNKFDLDFITKGVLIFKIENQLITCNSFVMDKNGVKFGVKKAIIESGRLISIKEFNKYKN